jgi:hypothetical protein
MKKESIERAIDNRIIAELSSGKNIIDVYYKLCEKIDNFSQKEEFIEVSKEYLESNWDFFNIKTRYISYYVIFSKKRKSELMWFIINKNRFRNISDLKLFSFLKLKNKLSNINKQHMI